MATTDFGANNPLTMKKWSKKYVPYYMGQSVLAARGIIGTGPLAIIQINKDLTKGKGKSVVCKMVVPPTGTGFGDNGTMVGNSEKIDVQNFEVEVHERGHSHQLKGPLEDQYTEDNFRQLAHDSLGIWHANKLDFDCLQSLCGLYNESTEITVVNELAPSTNRIFYGGQTVAGVVSAATMTTDALLSAETAASTLFGTKIIEIITRKGVMCEPEIRPVTIEGESVKGLFILHPYQIKALEAETAFNSALMTAGLRGKTNPLFKYAKYYWRNTIIHEYKGMPMRTGLNGTLPSEGFTLNAGRTATSDAVANTKSVACGLYLGAGAAMLAYGGDGGKLINWRESLEDAGRKPVIGIDMLYGIKKTRFNKYNSGADSNTAQEDYGVIPIHTQVVVD